MNIIGINAFHGDVAAALVCDGRLVAAVEEERFQRLKHCAGFPRNALRICLEMGGLSPEDIDVFAVSRNPRAHLARKAMFSLARRPSPRLLFERLRNRSKVGSLASTIAETLGVQPESISKRIRWIEHHPAHLASAFFVSPFEQAAVAAIDGFGDFVSTSMGIGRDNRLEVIERTFFPHSLGLLYLAITQFLGFDNYGDEFKVMGLAPYGDADFVEPLGQLVHLKQGGAFQLDLDYFRHWSEGVPMTWDEGVPTVGRVFTDKLERLLGPSRKPDEAITARHEAIAHSLQVVFESASFHVLRELHRRTGLNKLCIAGGCAMNSVMNGKIRTETEFEEVFIQPASGDNGTALGAAYHVWHQLYGKARSFSMTHGYWGTEFSDEMIGTLLETRKTELGERVEWRQARDLGALCEWTAEHLAKGWVIGWFQGRMEWGARALGNRSILADPRRADMREVINAKIKFRETFRPFAPSILEESLSDYFVDAVPDPFMVQVYPVVPERRGAIPAVTHVDGSGRLQSVSRESNPLYWELISAFERRTGVPVVLNTSFNENEPIVQDPSEALNCFLRTDMDALVLGKFILCKSEILASAEIGNTHDRQSSRVH